MIEYKLSEAGLELTNEPEGLTLVGNDMKLRADFISMLPRLKQSNLEREMLVKAARIKGHTGELTIIDATAGFGEDSILLAGAGFNVIMYEYDSVIALLLEDAMKRAEDIPELRDAIERMHLIKSSSIEAMKNLDYRPDVVYLDPMFPERSKSALIKKKFQLLQCLERPCTDEEELLDAAFAAGPKKIVIKRPLKGEILAGKKPSYSLSGKAIRYDCHVLV